MTDTTPDVTVPPDTGLPKTPSEASNRVRQSLRRRYAAEKRFRMYGLIAIGLALSFIVVLFTDIITKGHSAFIQSHLTLTVELDADSVDPQGDRSPESLRDGSYRGITLRAFFETLRGVSGRADQREALSLLSDAADITVRNAVLDQPDLVGTTATLPVKFGDDADIFFKGKSVAVEGLPAQSTATPSGTQGEITITADGPAFTAILEQAKIQLRDDIQGLEDDIAGFQRRIDRYQEELSQATDEDQRADLRDSIATMTDAIATDTEKVAGIEARIANPGDSEVLTRESSSYLIRINGGVVKVLAAAPNRIEGEVFFSLDSDRRADEGSWQIMTLPIAESNRRLSDKQVMWLWDLEERGLLDMQFNTTFFTSGDSREPEQAGIWGAAVGSFFTLMITLLLSFPIGVMTAVYLEEFAPKNKWTDLIEVNINNLAAVPSIVFGLLGLAMFLNVFGLPRSAPLVGGMVLTLMTLPTIIIAGRAALKAVPPSIREAALGMGASRIQAMTHHVLPLAMPGMMTGTIIGMAQALGETAPLLMIGMVAFIVDIPGGFTDPATVLPVQIYIWADSPERAFVEKTSAAIMVLLAFLITMNLAAVLVRKRFEKRW